MKSEHIVIHFTLSMVLNNTISDQDILIEGHDVVRRELCVGKGVGLLVCIINNIDYTRRREFERDDIEVIC